MDDELKLNSIARFNKKSTRLILEEMGGCEVPAGCGGVVMRWTTAEAGLPAWIRVEQIGGEVAASLNGTEFGNSQLGIPFGPGILAIHITARDSDFDWFVVRCHPRAGSLTGIRDTEFVAELCTSDDQSWVATNVRPGNGWQEIGFDDTDWAPLIASKRTKDELSERESWRFNERPSQINALALPNSKEIWIRKRFDLKLESPS